MIENVSEVANFDVEAIEKKFRESRKITVPDSLRTKHGSIDKMRVVLQNWWNIPNIDTRYIDKKSLYQYRYFAQNFLRGNGKCPKCYHSLIEEYKDFIINPPETIDTENISPQKPYGEFMMEWSLSTDNKAEALKQIMNNWDYYKKINSNDKRYNATLRGLIRQVRDYKNGNMKKVAKIYLGILSGKDTEIKTTSKKSKKNKELSTIKPQTPKTEIVVKRPETSDNNLVNIIKQLKEIGVTEFTIKF